MTDAVSSDTGESADRGASSATEGGDGKADGSPLHAQDVSDSSRLSACFASFSPGEPPARSSPLDRNGSVAVVDFLESAGVRNPASVAIALRTTLGVYTVEDLLLAVFFDVDEETLSASCVGAEAACPGLRPQTLSRFSRFLSSLSQFQERRDSGPQTASSLSSLSGSPSPRSNSTQVLRGDSASACLVPTVSASTASVSGDSGDAGSLCLFPASENRSRVASQASLERRELPDSVGSSPATLLQEAAKQLASEGLQPTFAQERHLDLSAAVPGRKATACEAGERLRPRCTAPQETKDANRSADSQGEEVCSCCRSPLFLEDGSTECLCRYVRSRNMERLSDVSEEEKREMVLRLVAFAKEHLSEIEFALLPYSVRAATRKLKHRGISSFARIASVCLTGVDPFLQPASSSSASSSLASSSSSASSSASSSSSSSSSSSASSASSSYSSPPSSSSCTSSPSLSSSFLPVGRRPKDWLREEGGLSSQEASHVFKATRQVAADRIRFRFASAFSSYSPRDLLGRVDKDIKQIADRVYSSVQFDRWVFDNVIDTPYVQRLRQLKQLGACMVVFPSATHTRFEHSLGVGYLARTFFSKLALKLGFSTSPGCSAGLPGCIDTSACCCALALPPSWSRASAFPFIAKKAVRPRDPQLDVEREEGLPASFSGRQTLSSSASAASRCGSDSTPFPPTWVAGASAEFPAFASPSSSSLLSAALDGAEAGCCSHCGSFVLSDAFAPNIFGQTWRSQGREVARLANCVEIAGLCHDLGHGPFSHSFEGGFVNHPEIRGRNGGSCLLAAPLWSHEQMSLQMVEKVFAPLTDVGEREVDEEDLEMVRNMIAGVPPEWMRRSATGLDPLDSLTRASFDIVANKRNGLDVDRFDYCRRDAAILPPSNPLPSAAVNRLLDYSSVIDSEICFNIKELHTVFNLFYTRFSLFKTVYTHRMVKAMELMLCEAFRRADPTFLWSDKIHSPDEFLELTDERLLYDVRAHPLFSGRSKFTTDLDDEERENLTEAKRLIDLVTRNRKSADIYRFAGEVPLQECDSHKLRELEALATPETIVQHAPCNPPGLPGVASDSSRLKAQDLIVDWNTNHYGQGQEDPLQCVRFYSPDNEDVSFLACDETRRLYPKSFQERYLRMYCKDSRKLEVAKAAFQTFCRHYGLTRQFDASAVPTISQPWSWTRGGGALCSLVRRSVSRRRSSVSSVRRASFSTEYDAPARTLGCPAHPWATAGWCTSSRAPGVDCSRSIASFSPSRSSSLHSPDRSPAWRACGSLPRLQIRRQAHEFIYFRPSAAARAGELCEGFPASHARRHTGLGPDATRDEDSSPLRADTVRRGEAEGVDSGESLGGAATWQGPHLRGGVRTPEDARVKRQKLLGDKQGA
ncbi:metal-dependent phosphohydrolase HD domain-containing protein [Toxoplasma gondii VAND]|uniref:Metal-dependent phosphohydrolase HD domain-containing protein n=1 Tax=Toxoplasma gondii VAND TaxID=933077 RepID=A0A086PPH9_TOXGO|nr:metal-dependent phosphohydrolase HD domain-containing protein [Toxoplasma gondii VAND]